MAKSQYIGDVVASVGKYKDKDGNDRTRFQRAGGAFMSENDNGEKRISIKLDALPLSSEWNGWLSVYLRKDRRASEEAEYNQQHASDNQNSVADMGEPVDLSDIPF